MRVIMVSGGKCDITQVENAIKDGDYIIGIDAGAALLTDNGIKPDLCIGDFDSVDVGLFDGLNVIKLKPEKDEIDTECALIHALNMNPSEILIYGATGSRMDQTLSSIELLRMATEKNVDAFIIDPTNRIRVAVGRTVLRKADAFGKYISILPYAEALTDLTMKGFKYEIENFTLVKGISRCISNEFEADTAVVDCSNYYILMETCD